MDTELKLMQKRYDAFRDRKLSLDMSRGKPDPRQLALSMPMLDMPLSYISEDGTDTRNYGDPTGIPEAKRLFGMLLGVDPDQVIVGGNSSVNLIYDALCRFALYGPMEGDTPWSRLEGVKILCPVPGYDWHFGMCQGLGFECVPIPMNEDGPDLANTARLMMDPHVKGMICGPMYGNPSGVTYSDAVVDALASLPAAASDFRIIWDNAYCVHHFYPDAARRDRLKNIVTACAEAGHPDRVLVFTSTSKITFAGAGVSAMAASPANVARHAALMKYQLVCYDKMNQLRHARFLPDMDAVERHMAKHAEIIRPKCEMVLEVLEKELSGIASWSKPLGGYFICFRAPKGCAKETVRLCGEAGITLTPAGAPFPGGYDPEDSVIRIAFTYPPMEELKTVMELFPLAVKMAFCQLLR